MYSSKIWYGLKYDILNYNNNNSFVSGGRRLEELKKEKWEGELFFALLFCGREIRFSEILSPTARLALGLPDPTGWLRHHFLWGSEIRLEGCDAAWATKPIVSLAAFKRFKLFQSLLSKYTNSIIERSSN